MVMGWMRRGGCLERILAELKGGQNKGSGVKTVRVIGGGFHRCKTIEGGVEVWWHGWRRPEA